jgi:short-subunit dehydrogenase
VKRKIADKCLLVTGASSGIGRELARQLSAKGARLIVTARRGELLDSLVVEVQRQRPESQIEGLAGDITDSDFRARLVETAQRRWGRLDGLINNAGVGAMGRFADSTPETLRQVMEVNFFAPVELIRLSLPLLQLGQQPIVVNMGSVLGHRAVPLKSEYCASKFALHGLSDSLRAELATQGIDLTMISPSTTDSEFFEHALQDTTHKNWKGSGASSVAGVANATIRAMTKGSHDVILTFGGKSLVLLDRLAPTLADHAMQRWAQ